MENQPDIEKSEYHKYFTEIEETFIRLRERNILMSPTDWSLIEQWKERDIPLETVCAAIEKCFARKGEGTNIKSLNYCRH